MDEKELEGLTGLAKAQAVMKMRREAGIKTVLLNPIEKAKKNPNSRQLAINAMCYVCEGEDHDPGVRWRIANCMSMDCPLRPFRPHQKHEGTPMPKALMTTEDSNHESDSDIDVEDDMDDVVEESAHEDT